LLVVDYDISDDEREVVFTTKTSSGESKIWLASLDRRQPPRQVAQLGDEVSFGAGEELIFRGLEEKKTNVLSRIRKDGTGRARVSNAPIVDKSGVSPDGHKGVNGGRTELGHFRRLTLTPTMARR
jgi:hypothetical protein